MNPMASVNQITTQTLLHSAYDAETMKNAGKNAAVDAFKNN